MFYTSLLFIHMVGLAMAVGTSFTMAALGKAAAGLPRADQTAFMLRALAVTKVASFGLLILILSGLGMLFMRLDMLLAAGGAAFHAKLTFVAVQVGLFGFLQVTIARVKRAEGGPLMARLPKIGQALLVNGLLIVGAAVLAFH